MNPIWTISQLDRSLPDGTVLTAHWRVTVEDTGDMASSYGTQSFTRSEDSAGFIPYDQLTEAQVIEWVQAGMGAEQLEALYLNLQGQIEAKKFPKQAVGTPW